MNKGQKKKKKVVYPSKRCMNLYYKPDRTSAPATAALYILFCLVILLGLAKILVYDLWVKVEDTRHELALQQAQLAGYQEQLTDYDEVLEKYNRYSATAEEDAQIDRMEILKLLDEAVWQTASIESISVNGDFVILKFSGVTLKETAEIVQKLEKSPIVATTTVDTAVTTREEGNIVTADVLIGLRKEGEEE